MIKFIKRVISCYKALDGVENPEKLIESAKIVSENSHWIQLTKGIIDFVVKVHEEQKPMTSGLQLTCIANVDCSKDEKTTELDFVSLWAGIGNSNPIERLKQVVNQRDAYKTMLKKVLEKDISEKEREEIEMTIYALELAS